MGVTVADVAAEGVRNALRGTDTQPALSPSFARANSNMNLPSSKKRELIFKYCQFFLQGFRTFKKLQSSAIT